MEFLVEVDWQALFVPKLSILEMILRGLLVYVALCLLLRVVLRRQAGKVALSDLLVITVVAGVCRNPLVADAYSIPDGIGVVVVVLLCSYAADWLSYHSTFIHALLHPEPVMLVRNGEVLHENLRNELMTEEQLKAKLRAHGIGNVSEVAESWMEGEGQVSAIRKKAGAMGPYVQSDQAKDKGSQAGSADGKAPAQRPPQDLPQESERPLGRAGRPLLILQGLYYCLTGLWPLVSIETFQWVTGRKTDHLVTGHEADHWLVMTVGALVTAIGLGLLTAARRRTCPVEMAVVAIASAVGLTGIDIIYVARQTIAPIYLVDAAAEVVLVLAWAYVLVRK